MKIIPIITKYMRLYAFFSALILVPGIIALFLFGLKPSIDFTGGAILEVKISEDKKSEFSKDAITEFLGEGVSLAGYQLAGEDLALRLTAIDVEQKKQIISSMKKIDADIVEKKYETVGPVLGRELIVKTLIAIIIAVGMIAIYLAIRFSSFEYGISAALATIHDALVVLGVFSLLGHFKGVEVDILFVTALLTILSFSVHDTIIVFDRIRERLKNRAGYSFEEIVNLAALETLNRSLRNSLAIIFMLLTVFLLTSGSLHWFVLALLIGTITGTYSSTCVALPLLLTWERIKKRTQKST